MEHNVTTEAYPYGIQGYYINWIERMNRQCSLTMGTYFEKVLSQFLYYYIYNENEEKLIHLTKS